LNVFETTVRLLYLNPVLVSHRSTRDLLLAICVIFYLSFTAMYDCTRLGFILGIFGHGPNFLNVHTFVQKYSFIHS